MNKMAKPREVVSLATGLSRPSREEAEAAAWLARLCSEERGPADEAAFQHWLAEDSRHQRAFDAVNTAWELAGSYVAPGVYLGIRQGTDGAPGVGVAPGVGAPGPGVAPANRGGPVNRVGVR